MRITYPAKRCVAVIFATFASLVLMVSPALAGEAHPVIEHTGFETDTFSNPNGIAVDESTGDVYVADLGTNTVSKFDANGTPVDFNFPMGSHEATGNALKGAGTPAGSFSFPASEKDNPAAIAVDNSTSASDPSAGDLYVLDVGHDVVDKFDADGRYLGQMTFESGKGEPIGVGVDASGQVYVPLRSPGEFGYTSDVFDNSATNALIRVRHPEVGLGIEYGFTVSPTGDMYLLRSLSDYGGIYKVGPGIERLGRVDTGADVAVAVDRVTGHVYADEQSSVSEWDAGEMNGPAGIQGSSQYEEVRSSGTLVSSFGSSQLSGSSSGQGGIGVNGATGEVYVANPSDGKVHVFGAAAPAVVADAAGGITQTSAALAGSVNPDGSAVSSCRFEYETASLDYDHSFAQPVSIFGQSLPCDRTPGQIGSGTSPVDVNADINGLKPGVLYHFRLSATNADGTSYSGGLFATQGPGFGVKAFEVSFLNQDGSPDTQAGSHPYEMQTSISYNTTVLRNQPNLDSVYDEDPDGGDARDLITDLPPGLVGDPNATPKKCALKQLDTTGDKVGEPQRSGLETCPAESAVGELAVEVGGTVPTIYIEPVYNMVPPHGVATQLGAHFIIPNVFINAGVPAGEEYPVQATSFGIPIVEPVIRTTLTLKGVVGEGATSKAFLTLPTRCTGPLKSSISVDSYEEPGHWVGKSEVTRNSAGQPVELSGCSQLEFPPTITVSPDTTDASTSSGLTVGVHVSQKAAQNPEGLAESALRDTTVTLPEGVAINPAGADGLEACAEGLAGFTGGSEFNSEFEPGVKTATFTPKLVEQLQPGVSFCPNGSKIGTVKIKTPLLRTRTGRRGVSGGAERQPVREPGRDVSDRGRPGVRDDHQADGRSVA